MNGMRVYVFSHIRLFSEALAAHLESCDEIAEVAICYLADHLVDNALKFSPDIILMDVTIDRALDEARLVNTALPETPILALALPENADHVIACADAGLVSYVPRQGSIEELVTNMIGTLKGECDCPPSISGSLLREIRRRQKLSCESLGNPHLTHRECKILSLLGRGLSNKLIAKELNLSVATVKNHVHNIFTKLQIHTRGEALARLRNEPWITEIA